MKGLEGAFCPSCQPSMGEPRSHTLDDGSSSQVLQPQPQMSQPSEARAINSIIDNLPSLRYLAEAVSKD